MKRAVISETKVRMRLSIRKLVHKTQSSVWYTIYAMNQQLLDYIKQQLDAGSSKESVKSILLQTGWPAADVEAALAHVGGAPAVAEVRPTVAAVPASMPSTRAADPIRDMQLSSASQRVDTMVSPMARPAASGAMAPMNGIARPAMPSVAEVSRPANSPTAASSGPIRPITPSGNMATMNQPSVMPRVSAQNTVTLNQPAPASAPAAAPRSGAGRILKVIFAGIGVVLFLGALALAGLLYKDKTDIGKKLESVERDRDSYAQLFGNEQKASNDANARAATLKAENDSLLSELAFFVPPRDGVVTTRTITVRGTLQAVVKGGFILLTSHDVPVAVKNGADAKVKAVLDPLVGSAIEIAGTHEIGSRDLTVTTVNGQPIQ